MPLGAKSRRRRRPQADAVGVTPKGIRTRRPDMLRTQRFLLSPEKTIPCSTGGMNCGKGRPPRAVTARVRGLSQNLGTTYGARAMSDFQPHTHGHQSTEFPHRHLRATLIAIRAA